MAHAHLLIENLINYSYYIGNILKNMINSLFWNCFFTEKDLAASILRVLQEEDPPQREGGPEASIADILSFEQFVTFLINGTRSSKMDELLSRKFHLNQVRFRVCLFWKSFLNILGARPCEKKLKFISQDNLIMGGFWKKMCVIIRFYKDFFQQQRIIALAMCNG